MIPRIKEVIPQSNYKLLVRFDSGETVLYDVGDDIQTIAEFKPLQDQIGLFHNVHLDQSRTCIYWTDWIDLPSDTILEYGTMVSA